MQTFTNQDIVKYVKTNHGASVGLLGGATNRLGDQIRPLTVPMASFDADAVQHAIDYVTQARRGMNADWHGVGFWVPEGEPVVVIDAIDLIEGLELATSIGTDRGEEAIYSLTNDDVIGL